MKLNSVASVVYSVSDIDRTVKFYTSLGFISGQRSESYASVRLNWFLLDFYEQKTKNIPGEGVLLGIKVDDAEELYKELITKDLKPEGKPEEKSKREKRVCVEGS